ncbi:alpha/beta hydrolase [Pseudohalioglobus sediminis]|uniref:Alpha/beta hydrolase n=1 Tax=Pseudohalioglobus sediminis TaxID=2606449 RepID=A0A5B0WT80_9GAMM|nr:alpha/beta hydrolase [Pseudohalioglobus sediminis]KAA1189441.1 alpha/beta hydrolase [Pseudohalioglobus sediminis]
MEIEHLHIPAGPVHLHLACAGEGPLVVMCHGYPGLWYSWRHQLAALAGAGYRAVALDMRGYGASSRPLPAEDYDFNCLSADVLAVLDYFAAPQAVLLGHDFGANLAWHMAIHHSDRIRAVAPLCVPYNMELAGGADVLPSTLFAAIAENHFFHMHYYQAVGVAEQSVAGREREFLTRLFWALSARGNLLDWSRFPSRGTHYIDVLEEPVQALPWPWLTVEDMDYYVQEYTRAGPALSIIGGANSYRVMDRNWQLFRSSAHAEVAIPTLWVGGQEDPVISLAGDGPFEHMRAKVKDLRGLHLLPEAGHFIQQEQPEMLNELLLAFLEGL